MFKRIKEDIETVFKKDPAAKNVIEVLFCYPGLHAIWLHRIAHWFYKKKEFVLARIISHINRFLTGIEIHPGAKIGRRFFIDHGSGVVIGETTEIGDDCLLYQGVVLGGVSLEKGKRHPTLEDGVVVGAGAIVLGPVRIGKGARIGAGAVVINDIPEGATAVGVPARISLGFTRKELEQLQHNKLPDPVQDAIKFVLKEIDNLEERIKKVETLEGITQKMDEYFIKKKEEIEKEFNIMKEELKKERENE